MSNKLKRIAIGGVVALATAAGLSALAPSSALAATVAPATAHNGICETGEFCLYHLANLTGSVADFTSPPSSGGSQPTCDKFVGPGEGQGECVQNNTGSAWNRRSGAVSVYPNSGYAGPSQTFASGQAANLAPKDQNVSYVFR